MTPSDICVRDGIDIGTAVSGGLLLAAGTAILTSLIWWMGLGAPTPPSWPELRASWRNPRSWPLLAWWSWQVASALWNRLRRRARQVHRRAEQDRAGQDRAGQDDDPTIALPDPIHVATTSHDLTKEEVDELRQRFTVALATGQPPLFLPTQTGAELDAWEVRHVDHDNTYMVTHNATLIAATPDLTSAARAITDRVGIPVRLIKQRRQGATTRWVPVPGLGRKP